MSAESIEKQDVDMEEPKEVKEKVEEEVLVLNDIKQNFAYLEKAVATFDPRYTLRVLRGLPALRKRLDAQSIARVIESTYPAGDDRAKALLTVMGIADSSSMDVDDSSSSVSVLPEIDIYLHLVVQVLLLNGDSGLRQYKDFCDYTITRLRSYNRRSLDYLAAKVWFYYSRAYELAGPTEFSEISPVLLAALRTATLRHDFETQASLVTLLLRNYLANRKVSQAANLVAKTKFPESASNALTARYFYYLARIRAIQLHYSESFEQVIAAIRKAPQTPMATGFLQQATKLSIVVELLMGDIPDPQTFKQPQFEKSLVPYFDVAKAVRVGDVAQFSETIAKHEQPLKKDGTYTLVLRLRQNVIKTGIKIMSLTYSKISLKDICLRLHLDSEESAEYIVARAIRDGVIEASIDHEKGFMQSKEVLDVYSTSEPQDMFHERIKFCISLHNDSIKSMRYLLKDHRVDLKTAEEAREREKELASEIQEGTDIDDDDGDFDI